MAWIGNRAWDDVVFLLHLLICASALSAALRAVWRGQASFHIRSTMSLFRRAISRDENVELRLKECLGNAKVRGVRAMVQMLFCIGTPVSLGVMLNIVRQVPRLNGSIPADMLRLALSFITVLPVVWPGSVRQRTLDLFHCSMFLLCCLAPWLYPPEFRYRSVVFANGIVIILLGARRTDSSKNLLLLLVTLAYAVSSSIAMARVPLCTGRENSFAPLFQFMGVFGMFVGATRLELELESSFLNSMQYEEAKEMLAAASALLRSCCEVVVELNSDGRIINDAMDLSSFLLRGPGHCLQGIRLEDLLVHPEEREQFNIRLAAPKLKDLGLAENMPVSIKDSLNNVLRLELLWFEFRRSDGKQYYKVGIREFSDGVVSLHRPNRPDNSDGALGELLQEEGKDGGDDDEEGVSTLPSRSSSLPETISVNSGPLSDGTPVVVLNTIDLDLPIIAMNTEFCQRIGRLPPNAPLTRYITQSRSFAAWLQDAVNTASRGDDPRGFSLTLRLPQGRVRAHCRVSFKASSLVDPERVPLRLFNVRMSRNEDTEVCRRHPVRLGTPTPAAVGSPHGLPATVGSHIMSL